MSRQYQNQNYQTGHYQTSHPYPPQQHGQFPPSLPNTYDDHPPSYHAHSSYPEGSLQPPPSGRRYGSSRSPYMETVSFPEPQHSSAGLPQPYSPSSQATPNLSIGTHHHGPQHSSAGPPQPYSPSSQTTPNLSIGTHHHGRQGSYGHPLPTGSSYDSQGLYAAGGGSNTSGGIDFSWPLPEVQRLYGGGFTATAAQTQDWDPTVYEEGREPRSRAPPNRPQGVHQPSCRYPSCRRPVFFDRRVDELREWCGDEHMVAAIIHRVEKPCKTCQIWPRRQGHKYCSGDHCRYSNPQYYR